MDKLCKLLLILSTAVRLTLNNFPVRIFPLEAEAMSVNELQSCLQQWERVGAVGSVLFSRGLESKDSELLGDLTPHP